MMPAVMMLSREAKRVPLDFDWPLNEPWKGYLDVDAYEEPPTGDGWQMWESVTEGSPISPVCQTREDLAEWMAANDNSSITSALTVDDWLDAIEGEVLGTDIQTGRPVR